MKNEKALLMSSELIRKVHALAAAKKRFSTAMNRFKYNGRASLKGVCEAAADLGYYLVIEPPEERGKWYNSGGQWRELLKRLVFHWWERKNAELILYGRDEEVDNISASTMLRKQLEEEGMSPLIFTEWLKERTVPSFENFCLLAMFEGFGVDWREIPEGENRNGLS
jgi:hypothetical protein